MIRVVTVCLALALALHAAPTDDLRAAHADITPESVASVERALEFLAAQQDRASGSWHSKVGYKLNQNYEVTAVDKPHVGVTALAGLAFLAAGHLPARGKYGEVIASATDYLVGRVGEDGYISDNGSRMYSHAFATLFLAEVYGMTDRSDVRTKLQDAVDFIVDCQNELGSWRYEPFAAESDMSITVCQLNALRAARNVGIRVPRSTIDRAADYVARSYVHDAGGGGGRGPWQSYYHLERGSFRYQAQSYTRSSFALTAAGLAALHNAGINGLRFSSTSVGEVDLNHSITFLRDTFGRVSKDSGYQYHYFYWYGHYYATQALYVIGGQAWSDYYPMVRREILDGQLASGAFPCKVGPGESFSTAVGAIILSLPYGYLPIFQR